MPPGEVLSAESNHIVLVRGIKHAGSANEPLLRPSQSGAALPGAVWQPACTHPAQRCCTQANSAADELPPVAAAAAAVCRLPPPPPPRLPCCCKRARTTAAAGAAGRAGLVALECISHDGSSFASPRGHAVAGGGACSGGCGGLQPCRRRGDAQDHRRCGVYLLTTGCWTQAAGTGWHVCESKQNVHEPRSRARRC